MSLQIKRFFPPLGFRVREGCWFHTLKHYMCDIDVYILLLQEKIPYHMCVLCEVSTAGGVSGVNLSGLWLLLLTFSFKRNVHNTIKS